MKDFLGKEINIGDNIVYLAGRRTGSSSRRNMLFKGEVIGFTTKMVIVLEEKYRSEEKIMPWNIVIIKEDK